MSAETLEALHLAIAAHARDEDDDALLSDWFVGYATTSHDGRDVLWAQSYAASESSPHAVVGVAELTLAQMRRDIVEGVEDE